MSRSDRSIAAFSLSVVFALSWLFQKSGASSRRVRSLRRASLAGVSKMPPEGFYPVLDRGKILFQFVEQHDLSPISVV